jgi:hypothetical protein
MMFFQVMRYGCTIKENGYNYAAVKCESNTGDDYSVGFLWSPDSV